MLSSGRATSLSQTFVAEDSLKFTRILRIARIVMRELAETCHMRKIGHERDVCRSRMSTQRKMKTSAGEQECDMAEDVMPVATGEKI